VALVFLVHVPKVPMGNMNILELGTNVFIVEQIHTGLVPIVLRKSINMNLGLESVVIVGHPHLVHALTAHQKSMNIKYAAEIC